MDHHSVRKLALSVSLAAALGILPAAAQEVPKGDPKLGEALAKSVCIACHGEDGNSLVPNYPHLAGQVYEYTIKQLRQFKSGERVDPFMTPMAMTVATEEDERNVAAWYASQVLKPEVARDDTLIARGRDLWRGGDMNKGIPACSGCHGPSGHGLPTQYPALAGQFPEYLALQLTHFRTGERSNDPGSMMRDIAEKLTDHDIKAVSEYAAGLR
ncbi:MAG: cytochrome c4 [Betaproteobacteria bacterium]|nr:cytochrome c4 [Betaproteobacteria bacterium]